MKKQVRIAFVVDFDDQGANKFVVNHPAYHAVSDGLSSLVDSGVISGYWALATADENFSNSLEDCHQPELAQLARLFGAMLRNAQAKVEQESELKQLREDARKWRAVEEFRKSI